MGLFDGAGDSLAGFLGDDNGPKLKAKTANGANQILGDQNSLYNSGAMGWMNDYNNGSMSSDDMLNYGKSNLTPAMNAELQNYLASGPISGSKFATEQVQNNPILGGLYGKGGQLNQAEDQLSGLYNQGFELKPEDHTLYGQASGNIARQFGQQGNQMANDLASRGMSNSGAAGAAFSGLAGNQNEQLANAQQQIMQQRFQNTQNQIGQYQNFVNSMGSNANNAINQQYQRQLSGAQNQRNGLMQSGQLQLAQNNAENSANQSAEEFNASHKPKNFMDFATAGAGAATYNMSGGMTNRGFNFMGMGVDGAKPGEADNAAGAQNGGGVNGAQNTYGSKPGLGYQGNYGG